MTDGALIEPLTGVGRHPFAKVGCRLDRETSIFDISYLNLSSFCRRARPPSSVFLDMGCAEYNQRRAAAPGRGSSIPLFETLYEAHSCVRFDKVVAWEARPYPNWWKKVPSDQRAHITFHNHKVNAEQVELPPHPE